MRKLRTAAALVGAVIITTLGLAYPANAATGSGKVVTAITDVGCGTATVSIVLANGVTGVYNARYYIGGDEAGRVASTGTTEATKTVTFGEDAHGGMVDLWVSVVDGPESDYRPKTIAAKVRTDCKDPAKPVVSSTGPTCASKDMTVTVTNPNTLPKDKVQVRVGFAEPQWLTAGGSAVKSVRGPVKVWAGSPLVPLTLVRYVRPSGCVSPSPSASASPSAQGTPTAKPTVSASTGNGCNPAYKGICLTGNDVDCADLRDSDKPVQLATAGVDPYRLDANGNGVGCESTELDLTGGNSDTGQNAGGLPVTGVALTGFGVAAAVLVAGGFAVLAAVRRRRQRFTA